MLVLTRKPTQTILIHPASWLPRDTPAMALFGAADLEIVITRANDRGEVRIGIEADRRLVVWRGEMAGFGIGGGKEGG